MLRWWQWHKLEFKHCRHWVLWNSYFKGYDVFQEAAIFKEWGLLYTIIVLRSRIHKCKGKVDKLANQLEVVASQINFNLFQYFLRVDSKSQRPYFVLFQFFKLPICFNLWHQKEKMGFELNSRRWESQQILPYLA